MPHTLLSFMLRAVPHPPESAMISHLTSYPARSEHAEHATSPRTAARGPIDLLAPLVEGAQVAANLGAAVHARLVFIEVPQASVLEHLAQRCKAAVAEYTWIKRTALSSHPPDVRSLERHWARWGNGNARGEGVRAGRTEETSQEFVRGGKGVLDEAVDFAARSSEVAVFAQGSHRINASRRRYG